MQALPGPVDTEELLTDIVNQLSEVVFHGNDATLPVIGTKSSGKSHYLFGQPGTPGIVERFFAAYCQHCNSQQEIPLIEFSIFQIYNEQVVIVSTGSVLNAATGVGFDAPADNCAPT